MLTLLPQAKLIFLLIVVCAEAKKPPGYVEPTKTPDPNPPKYEYGYKISDEKGEGQGKEEQREGEYALGRYYINGKDSTHNVEYFADDDWGYHPVVEYSSVGPHSRSTSHFALGEEAVKQLKNKENNRPQLEGILESAENQNQANAASPSPAPQQPSNLQDVLLQQPQQSSSVSSASTSFTVPYTTVPFQHQETKLFQNSEPQNLNNQLQLGGSSDQLFPVTYQQLQDVDQSTPPFLVNENQQNLSQEEQLQQEYNQRQSSIQNLQLKPQQVIVKHEEPSQKLIFPQEQIIADQKSHPKDNIIPDTDHQQALLVQQYTQPKEQQILVQTNIIHTQESKDREQPYETSALFENTDSKHFSSNLYQSSSDKNHFDESTLSMEDFGNFGSKVGIKNQNTVDTANKLIEHTKNLVTGEDVLNINEAISKDDSVHSESNTPNPLTSERVSQIFTSETVANTFSHSDVGYSSTTPSPSAIPSFSDQPIVVADFEDNSVQSTTEFSQQQEELKEEFHSSSSKIKENASSNVVDITEPSTILVTPRPVSTNFLAPITAGIQLQNLDLHTQEKHSQNSDSQNYKVEIQKSLPYYLGKFEYPLFMEQENAKPTSSEVKASENIELGKTLLFFPGPTSSQKHLLSIETKRPIPEVSNYLTIQQVPSTVVKQKFIEIDQQQEQGYQHQVAVQLINGQQSQNYHHVDGSNQVSEKPAETTKIVNKPYPVRVPYEVPYPVIKQVQVPVTVEKIIEKPIHITKYVERPVPIPQPYPVQKLVERPIHVPVHVTKYIDRPYPVEVRVPYPQPYPVEKVVQKIVKQPYPVEVRVPVRIEKIVKKVHVPQYIEKPIEKIVEKPVPHYVDRPVPVEVKVPVPQPYLVRVEVPRPYPIEVNKPLHKHYGFVQIAYPPQAPQRVSFLPPVQVPTVHQVYGQAAPQEQQAQSSQQTQTYFYANPYAYAPQINHYLPPKQEIFLNNGYIPVKHVNNAYLPPRKDCNPPNFGIKYKNLYYTIRPEDYVGLLPPKVSNSNVNHLQKTRTARSHFDDKSVRMEYGFMPPLIPSLEIDEYGNPIEKGEK